MSKPQISSATLVELPAPPERYLNAAQVRSRYGEISEMCLWRWLKDAQLAFPQPSVRIRDRRYWREADLVAWERRGAR
jgi:hypothetical protein